MLRLVLVAEEAAGQRALRLLDASEHEVVAVLSSSGRDPSAVTDPAFADELREVDLLLNVHSLHVARPEVVAAPRIGSFNLHPGPLPEYAGLNAPSWAIYDGRTKHAVTLHWMEAEVDMGPIAYADEFPIDPADTGISLSSKCVQHGLPLVERLLEDAASGSVPRSEQKGEGTWHGREAPHDGRLPWTLPAARVADLVRAADYSPFDSPWGHPVATLAGRRLEVVRVSPTGEPADQPPGTIGTGGQVAAADEWVQVERVKEGGRSTDPAKALRPGDRFDSE